MSDSAPPRRGRLADAPPLWLLYGWIYAVAADFIAEFAYNLARPLWEDPGWEPEPHPVAGTIRLLVHLAAPVVGAWVAAATVRREVPVASIMAGFAAALIAMPLWIVIAVPLQRPLTPRVWGLTGPVVGAAVVPAFRFAAGWRGRAPRVPHVVPATMWVVAWLASMVSAAAAALLIGLVGGKITYQSDYGGFMNLTALPGLVVGGLVGGVSGAVAAVAAVHRIWTGRWAPRRAWWLAAAAVLAGLPVCWIIGVATERREGAAPILAAAVSGLMAVLGFRRGARERPPFE